MEVQEEKKEGILVLYLKGRIDNFCSDILLDELQTIINTGCFKTIINLKEAEYLSASCLRTFLKADKRAKQYDGIVCLTELSEAAKKTAEFTRIHRALNVYPKQEEAILDNS